MSFHSVVVCRIRDAQVESVLYAGAEAERALGSKTLAALPGKRAAQLIPGLGTESKGACLLHKQRLNYLHLPLSDGTGLLLLMLPRLSGEVKGIYEAALDMLEVGVQIYDVNAVMLFLNTASEKMSGIKREDVIGKKLTSIYDTDELQSTVLSALSRRSSFYNLYSDFYVNDGRKVSVLNSSFPYLDNGGNMAGVINLEYTEQTISEMMNTIHTIQRIIPGATETRPRPARRYYRFDDIIGACRGMREAVDLARACIGKTCSVFIAGETGTGKELIAQSIFTGDPAKTTFTAINCSTIPENLADSILFGTVKGAFTGSTNTEGLFAAANGGILFLDEINSLSLSTQARLLRVLQEGTYMRVGSTKEYFCNVRILASCNQDPWSLMENNLLRRDLFYRLAAVQINLPPLRERGDDINAMVDHFITYYANKFDKKVTGLTAEARAVLLHYNWPGNIRELKNLIEFAVTSAPGEIIGVQELPSYISRNATDYSARPAETAAPGAAGPLDLQKQVESFERALIREALQQNNNNVTKTAESLSLSRQALQYKLKRFDILP